MWALLLCTVLFSSKPLTSCLLWKSNVTDLRIPLSTFVMHIMGAPFFDLDPRPLFDRGGHMFHRSFFPEVYPWVFPRASSRCRFCEIIRHNVRKSLRPHEEIGSSNVDICDHRSLASRKASTTSAEPGPSTPIKLKMQSLRSMNIITGDSAAAALTLIVRLGQWTNLLETCTFLQRLRGSLIYIA